MPGTRSIARPSTLNAAEVRGRWHAAGLRATGAVVLLAVAAMVGALETPGERTAVALCGTGLMETEISMGATGAQVSAVSFTGLGEECAGSAIGLDLVGASGPHGNVLAVRSDLEILSAVWSDQDACDGVDLGEAGLVTDGAVRIPLCEGHATRGWVPADALSEVALVTRSPDAAAARADVKAAALDRLQPATVTTGALEVVPMVLRVLAMLAIGDAVVRIVGRNRIASLLTGARTG